MMYPLVRELAAEKIPVAVTCRVLGFSNRRRRQRRLGRMTPVEYETLTHAADAA
jgi:hypothetical protein